MIQAASCIAIQVQRCLRPYNQFPNVICHTNVLQIKLASGPLCTLILNYLTGLSLLKSVCSFWSITMTTCVYQWYNNFVGKVGGGDLLGLLMYYSLWSLYTAACPNTIELCGCKRSTLWHPSNIFQSWGGGGGGHDDYLPPPSPARNILF